MGGGERQEVYPQCGGGQPLWHAASDQAVYHQESPPHARDAAFSVLVMAELLRALEARSDTRTVWQVGLLTNMPLFVIVVASVTLQLAMHHLPALQALFGTAPFSFGQGVAWLMLGSMPLGVLELRKVLRRSRAVCKLVGEAEEPCLRK
jgi:Ca2+-transporting ATPase